MFEHFEGVRVGYAISVAMACLLFFIDAQKNGFVSAIVPLYQRGTSHAGHLGVGMTQRE